MAVDYVKVSLDKTWAASQEIQRSRRLVLELGAVASRPTNEQGECYRKKVKAAHTRLPSAGFRS